MMSTALASQLKTMPGVIERCWPECRRGDTVNDVWWSRQRIGCTRTGGAVAGSVNAIGGLTHHQEGGRIGEGADQPVIALVRIRDPQERRELVQAIARPVAMQPRRRRQAREVEDAIPGGRGQCPGERRGGAAQAGQHGRGPEVQPVGEEVAPVAAEHLVAAVAGERNRHLLPGKSGDVERRDLRGIGERLIEHLGQLRDDRARLVRAEVQLGVVGPEVTGDRARVARLLETALVETDREGLDRTRRAPLHQRHDQRGMDPARQEGADRDVRDHAVADGLREQQIEVIERDRVEGDIASRRLLSDRPRAPMAFDPAEQLVVLRRPAMPEVEEEEVNHSEESIARANAAGADDVLLVDRKDAFADEQCARAIVTNAPYEGKYPLVSALSRPVIAQAVAEIALERDAEAVVHGCTGKGNDQLRFELAFKAHYPGVTVIAPLRDRIWTRDEEIEYALDKGIPVDADRRLAVLDR